jgi:hypothetical protein
MTQDSERFHAEELFKCYAEYVVRAHERIMLLEAALAECADALETAQQLTLVREIRELLADKSVHALRQLIDEHGGAMEHEHGRLTLRTTFRETLNSRQIALIGLPCTKNARRIFAIVSTISIPTSAPRIMEASVDP